LWPLTSHTSNAPPQPWISGHQRQNPFEAMNGYDARMAEGSAVVLVVDSSIDGPLSHPIEE
jgi:hypothetical protein